MQPAASGQPPAPGAPSQAQPPSGAPSPAAQPIPNRGLMAAGLARIGLLLKIGEETLPMLGSGSDAGKDLLKAIQLLSKHLPPGSVSEGVQQTAMETALLKQRQQQPAVAALRAQQTQPPAAAQAAAA